MAAGEEVVWTRMYTYLQCVNMQAKKLRNVQSAFKIFNSMMRRPGKGDLTFLELQVMMPGHLTYPPLHHLSHMKLLIKYVHAAWD